MSIRQLRARLDRLTQIANRMLEEVKDSARDFVIDPEAARALRDDSEREVLLLRKQFGPSENGGPLTDSEKEEQCMLPARIVERARAISCPDWYDLREVKKDRTRLTELFYKRLSPPSCGGGPLNEVEDAEEAQLTARTTAFEYSPEGLARKRIAELKRRSSGGISPAEQNELDHLLARYPDLALNKLDERLEAALNHFAKH